MATQSSVRGEERRSAIIAIIERDGSAQIDALAATLGVSEMTVRRDLDDLEVEGLVRRVRGGAVGASGPRPFGERRTVRPRAKQAIAAKAQTLLPRSGAIALDASSTVAALAPFLNAHPGLTVATNSWDNFNAVRPGAGITPVLIGGELDESTGSFVGKLACEAAESMLYQRFFSSASAVDPAHGSSEESLSESQIKRSFARNSRQLVLCVDSSKLDSTAVSTAFRLSEVHVMITDLDPKDPRLEAYRERTELL